MGAWGLASDENDWTYDRLGLGIMERMVGITLTEEGRSETGFVKDLAKAEGVSVLNDPGVAVWLLKAGCVVPLANLEAARNALATEDCSKIYPNDAAVRKGIVEAEIDMITSAMENGGAIPRPPLGVGGISSGGTRSPF